ncbi:MAG TPA: hypothetical protein VF530_17695 [Planctomycetota bacterium]
MSIVAALVLSVAGLVPQGEEPSLEEELAALVERTNRIETLHLVYEAQGEKDGEPETMTLDLVYRAPDFGRVRLENSEGGIEQWFMGTRVYFLCEERWQWAEFSSPPAAFQLLEEHFPRGSDALEPGLVFGLGFEPHEDGGFQFQLNGTLMIHGRDQLFRWHKKLQSGDGVVAEERELSWEEDGARYVVQRETGLLEQVYFQAARGWLRLTLREASVDEPLDPLLLELPEPARAAPESEELARALSWQLPSQRQWAFASVEWQLASGKREWNALARRQWEEVLGIMHRETILKSQAEMIAKLEVSIPDRAERSKGDRGEQDSPERKAWEEKVAQARANLESGLAHAETRYRESVEALGLPGVEPRLELLDVEAEVIAALWDELVREPMLALFDESFAEAAR